MSSFIVKYTGQLECGQFSDSNNLTCKFLFNFGQDWSVVEGIQEGITQQASSSSLSKSSSNFPLCVWNFPIDISFKSTNAFGWPQLVIIVYGLDFMGRSVVKGYGSVHLPISSGKHILYIPTFAPLASSQLNNLLGILAGKMPEFLDPKFPAKADGRKVTRVCSDGVVKVQLDVILRDFQKVFDM